MSILMDGLHLTLLLHAFFVLSFFWVALLRLLSSAVFLALVFLFSPALFVVLFLYEILSYLMTILVSKPPASYIGPSTLVCVLLLLLLSQYSIS